ncbi:MAG: Sensor histidine kinase BtsS [Stenotrophomonas maltophilia]|uniref:Sensor histidine kinase BtsS n=1 Tax=Stenotrophomonas maltophilia TaxID=40324 RepID=A0A7V8FEM7_STEMA|nr:MAG: Sensor histidine kinase BtsS [Stenotrophomonas maltophilia]
MPDSTSTLRFWLLNTLGWALFAVVSLTLTQVFSGGGSSGGTLINVGLGALLCGISGALRALALRRHWWRLGGGALLLRLAVAVLLGAALAQLLLAAVLQPALTLGWVDFGGHPGDFRPTARLLYWVNTALMLGLWTALRASLHSVRHARRAELERLRAEAQRSALERDALRAPLNPHFMFNALNNLRALILEDPERARQMVTHLSRTLRHALEHARHEEAVLADELAVVQDCLAVEAVHYEQRLQVRIAVSEAAAQARLPVMALQLLVENAIKHGIAMRPGGGEVRVSAHCSDGLLRLQVDNPLGHAAPGVGSGLPGHGGGLAYLRSQLGQGGRFQLQPVAGRMQALLEIPQCARP